MALHPVKRNPEQYFHAITLVLALALMCGGTPSAILQTKTTQVLITMWQWSTITSSGVTTISTSALEFCDTTKEKMQAMGAFAIVSIILVVFAFAFIVLEMMGRAIHANATVIASCFAWFCIMITWILGASTMTEALCGTGLIPRDNGYVFGGGFAAIVTAWVILTVSTPTYGVIHFYFRKRWDRRSIARASSIRTVHVKQSSDVGGGQSFVVSEDGLEAQDASGVAMVVTSPAKERSMSSTTFHSSHSGVQSPPTPLRAEASRNERPMHLSMQSSMNASAASHAPPTHAAPVAPQRVKAASLSMPSDVLD